MNGGPSPCDGPTFGHPPPSTWAPAWRPPSIPSTLWSAASPANPHGGHAYEWALTPAQQPSTSLPLIFFPAPPPPLPQLTPAEAAWQLLFVIGVNQVPPQQQTTQAAARQPLHALGGGQALPPQQTTQTATPQQLYVPFGSQALPQQQTPPEAAPQQLYVIGGSQAPPPLSFMLVSARAQPPHRGLLHPSPPYWQ